MKHFDLLKRSVVLMALALVMGSGSVFAQQEQKVTRHKMTLSADIDYDDGNYGYHLDTDKQEAVLYNVNFAISGDVTLPSSVTYNGTTYPVTEIFISGWTTPTATSYTVTIPKSIKYIEDGGLMMFSQSLYGCTSFAVESGNANFTAYNGMLLSSDYATLIACPGKLGTDISIPTGVTSAYSYAFMSNTMMTSLSLPSTLTGTTPILYTCTSLQDITVSSSNTALYAEDGILFNKDKTELFSFPANKDAISYTIPSTVTWLASFAFANQKNLRSVTIPGSVSIIPNFSFTNCTNLTNVTIGEGVKDIMYSAFYGCSALTTLSLPASLVSFDTRAVFGCSSLASFSVAEGSANFTVQDGVLFNARKDTLVAYPHAKTDTKYIVPSTVKVLGDYAFGEATNLSEVVLSSKIRKIEGNAFYDCSSLKTVYSFIPECPETATNAFYNLPSDAQLYVVDTWLSDYQNSTAWTKGFAAENMHTIGINLGNYVMGMRLDDFVADNLGQANSTSERVYNNVYAEEGDEIEFQYNVVSESGCDKLTLSVDGEVIKEFSGTASITKGQKYYFTTSGYHTVVFAYTKDVNTDADGETASFTDIYLRRQGDTNLDFSRWTSDNHDDSSTSSKEFKFISDDGDKLTYSYKVSSETGYDCLTIALDGEELDKVSGAETGDSEVTLTSGFHTLTASYTKDGSGTANDDTGTIDDIKVTGQKSFFLSFNEDVNYMGIIRTHNATMEYRRTFNNTKWQALFVPFALSYDDWADNYDVAKLNNVHMYDRDDDGTVDDIELEAIKVKSGSLLPNHPYLIRAKETGDKVITPSATEVHQTYNLEETTCSSFETEFAFNGSYGVMSQSYLTTVDAMFMSGGALVHPGSDLGPYRWYMTTASRGAQVNPSVFSCIRLRVLGDEGDETGVVDLTNQNESEPVLYINAAGVQSQKPSKGVNLVKYADGSVKKVIY